MKRETLLLFCLICAEFYKDYPLCGYRIEHYYLGRAWELYYFLPEKEVNKQYRVELRENGEHVNYYL